MMEKRWLSGRYAAVFGVLVIVGGAFYFVAISNQSRPAVVDITTGRESGMQMTHEVVLREGGYEPSTIVIAEGDTVVFRNERDHPFWPASNLHPSHTVYSAFDPREPIPAGGAWSFTFDRIGTWNYHDHLRSYFRGVIIVRESNSSTE